MSEKKIQDDILKKLSGYMFSGTVIYYERTPSFRASGITVGRAGKPDIMVIVNQENGSIALLWLEVKLPGKKLGYEQKEFFTAMEGKPKTLCVIINDVKQINTFIRQAKAL